MTKEQIDRLNFWGKAVTKYGISTTLLLLLLWWFNIQLDWFKGTIATPLVTNHLEFMRETKAILNQQADTLEKLEETNATGFADLKAEHAKTREALEEADAKQTKGREEAVKTLLERVINGKHTP